AGAARPAAGRTGGDPLHRVARPGDRPRVRRARALPRQRHRQLRPFLYRPRRQRAPLGGCRPHGPPRPRPQPAFGRHRAGQHRPLPPLARLATPGDGRAVPRGADRRTGCPAAPVAGRPAWIAPGGRPRGPRHRDGRGHRRSGAAGAAQTRPGPAVSVVEGAGRGRPPAHPAVVEPRRCWAAPGGRPRLGGRYNRGPRTRRPRMTSPVTELIDLLSLERLEVNLFRGQSRDIGTKSVFGGQVLGQALSAAQATLTEARTAHSLHAYFLKAGDIAAPVVYQVDRTRDGGSFSVRRVTAIQHGGPIFFLAASFQKDADGDEHTP